MVIFAPAKQKPTNAMYVDTHSHLYAEEFDTDRDDTLQRAFDAGVTRLILPDIDASTRQRMFDTAERHPSRLFPTLGLHPTSVDGDWRRQVATLEHEAARHPVVAIGECGIDLYWDTTYRREQIAALEWQVGFAHELNLPLIIHSRESLPDIFAVLEHAHHNIKGVLHCFPGNEDDAARARDLGFLLGIGGVVTFKRSTMADVVARVGVEPLLLETDAPYLAPVPHRRKRNESSYIPLIAAKIAEITGVNLKKVAAITSKNAEDLFNLPTQNTPPGERE